MDAEVTGSGATLAMRNEPMWSALREHVPRATMWKNLDALGFNQRQELLRLLVEKVYYRGTELEISTIIPLSGEMCQLHPLPREGARG